MTAYLSKSFAVACSSGDLSADEARARWEAVFGRRPERVCEFDDVSQTMHFSPCSCQECEARCRICGATANSIRGGRIVLVSDGRCGDHAEVGR